MNKTSRTKKFKRSHYCYCWSYSRTLSVFLLFIFIIIMYPLKNHPFSEYANFLFPWKTNISFTRACAYQQERNVDISHHTFVYVSEGHKWVTFWVTLLRGNLFVTFHVRTKWIILHVFSHKIGGSFASNAMYIFTISKQTRNSHHSR